MKNVLRRNQTIFSLVLGFEFIESSKSLRNEIVSFIVLYEIETTRIRAVFPFAHWLDRAPLKHPKKPLTSDNENLTVVADQT
ncbi:hypothetical protein V1478_015420 [Vespula squamosa]|uniref:Uncharacterized protein n=1 Tax=Vespula squamosa TaxID=30214 RepID=A0ABD2A5E7_VESSQ